MSASSKTLFASHKKDYTISIFMVPTSAWEKKKIGKDSKKDPLILIVNSRDSIPLYFFFVICGYTHVYVIQKFDGYIKAKGKQTFTDFFLNGSSKAIFEYTQKNRVSRVPWPTSNFQAISILCTYVRTHTYNWN